MCYARAVHALVHKEFKLSFNVIKQKLYQFYSALCDNEFQHLSEKERIYQYSTPKVHRLLQILKIYTPFYTKETNTPEKKAGAGKNLL